MCLGSKRVPCFPVDKQCTDLHKIKERCVENECGRAGIQVGQTVFSQSWQLLVVVTHYCTTLTLFRLRFLLCLTHSTQVYNYAAFIEILWIYSNVPINCTRV